MAKKPPSYENMVLGPIENAPSAPAAPEVAAQMVPAQAPDTPPDPASRPRSRTLKDVADPVMIYLNPAAVKALKRYALDQNTKVHSLLLEAIEDWFKRHGLREPVRADTGRPR